MIVEPGARQPGPAKRDLAMPREVDVRLSFEREAFRAFLEYARLNDGPHLKGFLESVEKNILCRVLARFNGNQRRTAVCLGMKYTTVNGKVKKYGIRFRKTPVRPPARPPIP